MWTKILLMTTAAMLIMLSRTVLSSELQEKDVAKRQNTLADLTKMIQHLEQRMKGLEIRTLQWLRGKDGRDGQPGKPGRDGRDGQPGKQGQDGKDGAHGKPGPQGPQGPTGKDGLRGLPGLNGGGVEYIRWGRTTCPSGADIVYKGRIGGEWYNHYGGGANYVCASEIPQYDQRKPSRPQSGAYLYGTEYQMYYLNPSTKSHLLDHEAPCVACHVKTRSSKLMIPARYDCPAGWTREYHGYLMAEHHTHKNNKGYVCVDRDAEVVSGTNANLNGATLHIVQGRCGSLPCRPYVEGWELTCAVCTK